MINFLGNYYGLGSELLAWALGIVFVVHGWSKLKKPAMIAGVFGGSTTAGFVLGAVEVFAGVGVALNIYADWGLLAIAAIMLGAIFFKVTKWKTNFVGKNAVGWEFDLVLLTAALALLLG